MGIAMKWFEGKNYPCTRDDMWVVLKVCLDMTSEVLLELELELELNSVPRVWA